MMDSSDILPSVPDQAPEEVKNDELIQKEESPLHSDKTFLAKNRGVLGKYFKYIGHVGKTDKLKAVCVTCQSFKKNTQPHSFDNHNFKSNAKRHYAKVHPNVEWKDATDHHQISNFFSPASIQSQLTEKDPLQQKINGCYLDCVCIDGLPMSFTRGLGFQHLMFEINQRIRATERRTLTRILEKKVDTMARPKIVSEIQDIVNGSMHLSTDIWTSRKGDGIIALRGQYVIETDGSFKIIQRTLGLKKFNERHTGDNIREEVMKILSSYQIDLSKVGYIVTDGAKNMISAFKTNLKEYQTDCIDEQDENTHQEPDAINCDDAETLESYENLENTDLESEIRDFDHIFEAVSQAFAMIRSDERFSCFVHTLQLVINDGLKQDAAVRNLLSDIKKIVRFFNKATYWKNKLREKTQKDLIQPAPTRWSSYYDTLSRISEENMYKAVMETIIEAKGSSYATGAIRGLPNLPARSLILELTGMLSHIATATDKLQGNGVTSAIILYQIASCFDDICRCSDVHFPEFKIQLLRSIQSRFQNRIQERFVVLAALLDPRQKMSIFELQISSYNGISLQLPEKRTAERYLRDEVLKSTPVSIDSTKPRQGQSDDMFAKLGHTSSESSEVGKLSEVDKYLLIDRENVDPLQYWFNNKTQLPKLSLLSKRILSIPASTGDVERLFSTAGSFARARRSSLTPKTLENMMLYRESRLPELQRWKSNLPKRKCNSSSDASASKRQKNEKSDNQKETEDKSDDVIPIS